MPIESDYSFHDRAPFDAPGYPKLHFVEERYAGDTSNWWIPNRACVEAVLRSSGFTIEAHPEPETYICRTADVDARVAAELEAARGTRHA